MKFIFCLFWAGVLSIANAEPIAWSDLQWALEDDVVCGEQQSDGTITLCENFYVLGEAGSNLVFLKKVSRPSCQCLPFQFVITGPDVARTGVIDLSSKEYEGRSMDEILNSLMAEYHVKPHPNRSPEAWPPKKIIKFDSSSVSESDKDVIVGYFMTPGRHAIVAVKKMWVAAERGQRTATVLFQVIPLRR